MATPVFVHGRSGLVTINGSSFNAMTISLKETIEREDITYTQPGGATYAVKIPGYVTGSGAMHFIYDTANQPTISPFDLRPGKTPLSVVIYPDGTKPYSFTAVSMDLEFTTGPTAGAVKCDWTFETSGAITEPAT